METDWSKVIERYLGGELSAEGIEAFEFELSLNPDLRSELDLHKMIHESVFRSAERLAIQSIGTKYHFRLKLKKWLMFTSVVVTIATTIALVALNDGGTKSPTRDDHHFISETGSDNQLAAADPINDVSSVEPAVTDPAPVPVKQPVRPGRGAAGQVKPRLIETEIPGKATEIHEQTSQDKSNEVRLPEPKPEPVKTKTHKKQRLILSKGLINSMDVKEGSADTPIPSGAHWTLGNFMIYASENGIIFHNFLTDDVIVVGRTPKDQLRPPSKIPREGVEEEELQKDKGTIYLQNY